MPRRNVALLLLVALVAYACYVRAEQNPYARYVAAGFSVIDRWALYNEPSGQIADHDPRRFDQELYDAAMTEMVKVLQSRGDEHSQFIPAEQRDRYSELITQEFVGIGIRFHILGDPPLPTVLGPPEVGSPAAIAGLHSGDRIAAVDGKPTTGLNEIEVASLVRGPSGSRVTLSVQRDQAEPLEIVVERSLIVTESVIGEVRIPDGGWQYRLPDRPGLAYVRIIKFGDKTLAELETILARLADEPEGLDGLTIDLRGNPGGSLEAAVGVSDLFLRAGRPIVTTRGRRGEIEERFVSTEAGDHSYLPIAAIIDQDSASASEILAAALQDYDRADVVGTRSYGKGTVQRVMRLEGGRSLLKLTSATYWRPSGKNIHRMPEDDDDAQWGVAPTPGCEVKLDKDELKIWNNYRLRRATIGASDDLQLVAKLNSADGEVPDDYIDRALELAAERLVARVEERRRKSESAN
ncbi:MAG: PDZ domain-containing protein [Pirellulales bacterium]|nr:PDZ domain-containing protein [Pirellulales bacterium]